MKRSCLTFVMLLLAASCARESPYEHMIRREAARSDTLNGLFLSYQLGMTRQAFYDSSWALNRRGLVKQGPQNLNVQFTLREELAYPATMLFYPDFEQGHAVRMRVRFSYDAWAPWNRHLWADSLLQDVHKLARSWYGSGFLSRYELDVFGDTIYSLVKVDANRHVELKEGSEFREVLMTITDLRAAAP